MSSNGGLPIHLLTSGDGISEYPLTIFDGSLSDNPTLIADDSLLEGQTIVTECYYFHFEDDTMYKT